MTTDIDASLAAAADRVAKLAGAAGRDDLVERIRTASARHAERVCTVAFVGEFKMGKSSIVNAIANAPLCPVDDDVATAKPLEVGNAAEPTVSVVYKAGEDESERRVREITFEEIPSYVTEPPTAEDADSVALVRVGIPRKLFASGLSLIDTPGVGGLGSSHSAMTISVLPMADAVVFVSDASQELTAPELDFLDMVLSICPNLAMVMPKTDFYPHWRQIRDLNHAHFARRGLEVPIIAVSTMLRALAIEENDSEMNSESGYADLVSHLRDRLVPEARRQAAADFAATLYDLLDELASQLASERTVLSDPETAAREVRDLEARKEDAQALRNQAARWQQTLGDGTADLNADIEHDLRARFREIGKEAERAVDDDDPADIWDDFAAWLSDQVNRAIVQNFGLLHQRSAALAEHVAEHFDADTQSIISQIDMHRDAGDYRALPGYEEAAIASRKGLLSGGFSALRGSMGGMVMVGILGAAAPITLAAWVAPAIAGLVGRKTLKDERERGLAQRRLQAKQAVRKYTDEAQFVAVKDARDSLRQLNRKLRDHFLARADELSTSTAESLAAAQQAIRSSEEARSHRLNLVSKILDEVQPTQAAIAAVSDATRPLPA